MSLTAHERRGLSLVIPRRHWLTVGLATACYLLLWNIASTYAAVMIPSGQAAVLGFTMPLWAALISWAVLGEKLGPRLLLALGLGAVAVLLLAWRSLGVYAQAPLGVALGLLAGIGWAVGTLVLKRADVGVHPLVLSGWQLLGVSVPTALGAVLLLTLYPFRMTSTRLVGTDIVHAIPLTVVAGTGHLLMGHVDLALLGKLLLGSVPGVLLGSLVSARLPDGFLRPAIAVVLAAVSAKMLMA